MSLPCVTRPEDVKAIVKYLSTKPSGATLKDVKAVMGPKIIDFRKIAAFQTFGVINREGSQIRLTSDVGRNLARVSTEEEFSWILLEQVARIPAYRGCLEWAYHQGLSELPASEVGAHWHDNYREELATDSDKEIALRAVCFLQFAAVGGLGNFVTGRRGQESRLIIHSEALESFVTKGPVPQMMPETEQPYELEVGGRQQTAAPPDEKEKARRAAVVIPVSTPLVFISHSKNKKIVEQIKTMLDLAGLECEIATEEETTAIPVHDKVLSAMRKCTSAIICVTADKSEKGGDETYDINQNVLIEIGSAFVLYNKKVVLVWDKRIPIPSNLQGLYRCEFTGDELSWSEGMKLMKALNKFKSEKTN